MSDKSMAEKERHGEATDATIEATARTILVQVIGHRFISLLLGVFPAVPCRR